MDPWIKQGPVFDPQYRKGRRKRRGEGRGEGEGEREGTDPWPCSIAGHELTGEDDSPAPQASTGILALLFASGSLEKNKE